MLTSRDLKELRALQQRRKRVDSGRFVAEGVRIVEDLLESSIPIQWVVTTSTFEDTPRGRALLERAETLGVARQSLDDRTFRDLTDTETPQGVIAVAQIPKPRLESLDPPVASRRSIVLVLDAVQDPGNLGTMIRSAEAFGAMAVVILPGTVDPWNPKVVRSAAGSSFRVPIISAAWPEARDRLTALGYDLIGAAPGGGSLGNLPEAAALVLGNEGSGLSADVEASVDRLVGIPTPGRAESLNVTAAAAILLYELAGGSRAGEMR